MIKRSLSTKGIKRRNTNYGTERAVENKNKIKGLYKKLVSTIVIAKSMECKLEKIPLSEQSLTKFLLPESGKVIN